MKPWSRSPDDGGCPGEAAWLSTPHGSVAHRKIFTSSRCETDLASVQVADEMVGRGAQHCKCCRLCPGKQEERHRLLPAAFCRDRCGVSGCCQGAGPRHPHYTHTGKAARLPRRTGTVDSARPAGGASGTKASPALL